MKKSLLVFGWFFVLMYPIPSQHGQNSAAKNPTIVQLGPFGSKTDCETASGYFSNFIINSVGGVCYSDGLPSE